LCQAGPKNPHQRTEGKPNKSAPVPLESIENNETIFKCVITGDGLLILQYDPAKKITKFGVANELLTAPKKQG
jgi:hypothetical protein